MPIADQIKKVLDKDALSHGYLFIGQDTWSIKDSLAELLKELESSVGASIRTTEPLRHMSERKSTTISLGAVRSTNLTFGGEKNNAPLIDTGFFSAGGGSAFGGEGINGSSIGIDVVRRLKEFLWQKPIKSLKKTAVIVGGDMLTPEAQNALLKISEDPPLNAQIFIILKSEENLLPTLRSRFLKIHIIEDTISETNRHQIPEVVTHLAKQFLKSDKRERNEIIKLVTGKGTEADSPRSSSGEAKDDKTLLFLDALIIELSKDPVKHASFLGAILERKALIATLSLNKRLQLAYLSSLWYNR